MFDPESLAAASKSAKANEDEKSKKHTLDSDEEDGGDDHDKLDDDDIEGQEEDTIAFDGNITIMPFNMKEEMETGHFDTAGTYIFNKDDEIRDGWMDNIDWVKVKQTDKSADAGVDDGSSSDEEPEPIDKLGTWKEMIPMMKPGETVSKALRRLGGNKKMTSAQRLKAKKQGIKQTEEELKNEQLFQNLTSLADRLIQSGYMEVYEDTYEKINYHLSQSEADKKRVLPADEDEALDMFGEQFDQKHSSDKVSQEPSSKKVRIEEKTASAADTNEVMWEFKYEDREGSEIHGPFTSSQMQEKVDSDEFAGGVYARKVASGGGSFYSSKRIDFELYT